MHIRLAALFATSMFVGCGGGAPAPTSASSAAVKPPATLDEQTAAGGKVYAGQCAGCHGKSGEGGDKAPALVGSKSLDDYKNAREAFDFIQKNMPPDHAGSLSDDDYWAVVAFLVKTNEIPIDKVLGPASAADVKWSR